MSTSDRTAVIDSETGRATARALRVLEKWRLPLRSWEEIGELLARMAVAAAAGDTATVDELTAELEISGRRVGRIGSEEPPDDGKVPLPEPMRDRVVALIHAVDPDAGTDGQGSAAPAVDGK